MKHRTGYACAFSLFTLFLGAADITWTGAGADTRFSTAANWDTVPSFDGSETFIFAEAGTTATVDGVFSLGAIRFNRSNSFTLVPADGTANIHLGTGGITVLTPTAGTLVSHTNAVPLTLSLAHEFQIASNLTMAITGPVSGGTPTHILTKTGDGTLLLTGTNTFESPLVISNGFVNVNNGTALGNPTNTITIYRTTSTANSWTQRGPLYFTDTVATNNRPIIIGAAVSYIGQAFPQNGILVLNGLFTFLGGGRIDCQGTLIFRGGFDSHNGDPWMQTAGGSTVRFLEKPLTLASRGLSLDNYGTLHVCTTNNTWGSVGLFKGTFLCGAANVVPTNSYITFGVGYASHGFLDLNGFDQQVRFLNYNTSASGTTNMIVRSAEPATLTLQGDASARPFIGYFSGRVSLRHRNTGTLALTSPSSASTTTGDLRIEAGTVAFRSGAKWTGSTNIFVTAGTLSVEGGNGTTFGGNNPVLNVTRLNLTSASTVNLNAGITEYVNAATLDGIHLPNGTYGSLTSTAQHKSERFTGTGILHVLRWEFAGTLISLH